MTDTVQALIEQRRSEMFQIVSDAIEKPMELAIGPTCRCLSLFIAHYLTELRRCQLWPLSTIIQHSSPQEILARMDSIRSSKLAAYGASKCPVCRSEKMANAVAKVASNLRAARKRLRGEDEGYVTGLCLDCVKAGRQSHHAGSCSAKHTSEATVPWEPMDALKTLLACSRTCKSSMMLA